MMYDILVKGGEVVDPSQGIHGKFDVSISSGKIAAVEAEIAVDNAKEVIDAKGNLVVPGLIDIHAHPAEALADIGVNADELGIQQGVTTICDGGTLGCANFAAARMYINSRSKTDVFWFIHGCRTGQVAIPEIHGWHDIDNETTLKVIEENRDIIRGIKFRAIGSAAKAVGIEGAKTIKRIANEAGLPLMVHLGICFTEIGIPAIAKSVEPYTKEVLQLLGKGDIITHIYTPKVGGMIKLDGSILPEFKEAIERGAILDIAHGGTNFSVEIAKLGIEQGIIPHIISTDASAPAITMIAEKGMAKIIRSDKISADVSDNGIKDAPFSLAAIMSKLIALGLTLDQVIEMTTINPARALSEEQRIGSLKVGTRADVTILQLFKQDVIFPDRISDVRLEGRLILVPKLTLKSRQNDVAIVPLTCPK